MKTDAMMEKMRTMKKRILLLSAAGLFLVSLPLLAERLPGFSDDYKDPFLAGILSWVMPGAGQIYAHAYTRGSFFVLGELVDKTALLSLFLYLHDRYSRIGGQVSWLNLNDTEKGLVISYALLSVGFRIYTSLDAVRTTQRYDRLRGYDTSLLILPGPSLGVSLEFRRNL